MATPDSLTLVQDFMDAVARRFAEFPGASYSAAGMATLGTNDNHQPSEFGSSGFAMDYFEEDFLTPTLCPTERWLGASRLAGLAARLVRQARQVLSELG